MRKCIKINFTILSNLFWQLKGKYYVVKLQFRLLNKKLQTFSDIFLLKHPSYKIPVFFLFIKHIHKMLNVLKLFIFSSKIVKIVWHFHHVWSSSISIISIHSTQFQWFSDKLLKKKKKTRVDNNVKTSINQQVGIL